MAWQLALVRTRCCLIVLAGVWSGAKSIVLHTYKCSTSGVAVTYAAQPHAAQPDQQIHITFLLKFLLLLLSKKASIGWSCTVGNTAKVLLHPTIRTFIPREITLRFRRITGDTTRKMMRLFVPSGLSQIKMPGHLDCDGAIHKLSRTTNCHRGTFQGNTQRGFGLRELQDLLAKLATPTPSHQKKPTNKNAEESSHFRSSLHSRSLESGFN